jgi:hypothetical protein
MGLVTWVETYVFKTAAAQAVKGILDKLPADGGKTFLGVLLVVLGEVAKELPAASFSPFVATLITVVQAAGPAAVVNSGIAATIVGLIHKILKYFNPELPDEPEIAGV